MEIPRRYKTEEGYALGDWIFTQRSVYRGDSYGTLDAERIRKLESIGMVWDSIRDLSWQRNFAEAKLYFEEYGDLNVPSEYKTKSSTDLAAWIRRIRTYRKSGHLDIPADYCTSDGLKTGVWIRRQRALRSGKAKTGVPPTEEQIARLDEIGMIWKNQHENAWDMGYQAAFDYHKQYGNLNVPTGYIAPDGYKLGAWLADRREKGKAKHSAEQQKQLDALGMIWSKPDSWEIRYELAKQYYDEHGRLNIPSDYKPQGIWLAKWLNEQKQIYIGKRNKKSLTEEQIERLEQIGMVWLTVAEKDWKNYFESAERYYQKYGDLEIPSAYVDETGFPLGMWTFRVRTNKIKLKASEANGNQIERLKKIGLDFSSI